MEATTRQQMEDTFYILATDAPADYVSRILKDGETFAVFDPHGDIQATGTGQEGLYHEGTRFFPTSCSNWATPDPSFSIPWLKKTIRFSS
jgi:hypothetical protein